MFKAEKPLEENTFSFVASIVSLLITGISGFLQNRDEMTPAFDAEFEELFVPFSETAHFDFFLRGAFLTTRVGLTGTKFAFWPAVEVSSAGDDALTTD